MPLLRQAYQQTGLLKREMGLLLIETIEDQQVIGYVRNTQIPYPNNNTRHLEIRIGLPAANAHRKVYAKETIKLLVDYLFSSYPTERIGTFMDNENIPAQRVMDGIRFQREGTLRRAMFRDGQWRGIAIYGILRQETKSEQTNG